MATKTLKNLTRELEAMVSVAVLDETHDRPAILDMTKEEWNARGVNGLGELFHLTKQIQDYFFSVANRELGHLTYADISPDCCVQSIENPGKSGWVGLARWNGHLRQEIALNHAYTLSSDSQWEVLTETIPHEVAHIVWNQLRKDLSYSDQIRLGFRSRTGRFSSHGLLWKEIFKKITGFKKIKSRYFRCVVR